MTLPLVGPLLDNNILIFILMLFNSENIELLKTLCKFILKHLPQKVDTSCLLIITQNQLYE